MDRRNSPVRQKTKKEQINYDFEIVQKVLTYDTGVRKNQIKKAIGFIKRIKYCLVNFDGKHFFYKKYKLKSGQVPDTELMKDIEAKILSLFPSVRTFDLKNNLFTQR